MRSTILVRTRDLLRLCISLWRSLVLKTCLPLDPVISLSLVFRSWFTAVGFALWVNGFLFRGRSAFFCFHKNKLFVFVQTGKMSCFHLMCKNIHLDVSEKLCKLIHVFLMLSR